MQEAHCHACQMTGFKQERETEWCSMCSIDDVKETPPGDAPLSSSPYANRQSLCVRVFVCRYRASRNYILVSGVNVVASPPLLLLSPLSPHTPLPRPPESLNIKRRRLDLPVGRHAFILSPIKEVLAFVTNKRPFRQCSSSIRT
jgi:hypothetical protein